MTSFNLVAAEDNIILTARPGEIADADPEFYVYTKDIRESITNVVGTDGTPAVSYSDDAQYFNLDNFDELHTCCVHSMHTTCA